MRANTMGIAAVVVIFVFGAVDASCLTAGTDVLVPAAARATGRNDAQWIMDMYILNPGSAPANVTVYWLVRNRANTSPARRSYI